MTENIKLHQLHTDHLDQYETSYMTSVAFCAQRGDSALCSLVPRYRQPQGIVAERRTRPPTSAGVRRVGALAGR